MQSISKGEFAGLNDKIFYFHDAFWSPSAWKIKKRKKRKKHRFIHLLIKQQRKEYLKAEAKAVRQCERLRVLRYILFQAPVLYKFDSTLMYKGITKLPSKFCIKFALVMISSILLINVTATILNYAAKQYLQHQFLIVDKTRWGETYAGGTHKVNKYDFLSFGCFFLVSTCWSCHYLC